MKKTILCTLVLSIIMSSAFAQTGDPWIKKVYNDTWGRNPTAFEYNITNYNNGHWNNYGELIKYVYEFQKNLNSAGITMKYSQQTVNNNVIVGFFQNGTQIAADLISNDGGSIIAQGGNNIVAQGAGNIVAQGAGNIVAQGAGNITVNSATKGASFGSASYRLTSADTKVIKTSSGGALIIR